MPHVVSLFVLRLYLGVEDAFARSLRICGNWRTLARRIAPELVALDLMRHSRMSLFLYIDF